MIYYSRKRYLSDLLCMMGSCELVHILYFMAKAFLAIADKTTKYTAGASNVMSLATCMQLSSPVLKLKNN